MSFISYFMMYALLLPFARKIVFSQKFSSQVKLSDYSHGAEEMAEISRKKHHMCL